MRRWQATACSGIFLFFLLIGIIIFGRQLKQRFDEMQKLKRLRGYFGELESVSESMLVLEQSERDVAQDLDLLKDIMWNGFNVSGDPPASSNTLLSPKDLNS